MGRVMLSWLVLLVVFGLHMLGILVLFLVIMVFIIVLWVGTWLHDIAVVG